MKLKIKKNQKKFQVNEKWVFFEMPLNKTLFFFVQYYFSGFQLALI